MMKNLALVTGLSAILCAATSAAQAHDIIRYTNPTFPIATSVSVPAEADVIYVSGTLADVADEKAPPGSIERFGDTAAQSKSVLAKIAKELESAGFTMADVVKMNVYLVGDPRKGGAMDFEGLMQAYMSVYGLRPTEKKLPARTTLQVAGLPVPGALVEIEAVAARLSDEHAHASAGH